MNNEDKFRAAVKKFDDANKELDRLRLAVAKAEKTLTEASTNLSRVVKSIFGRKHVVYGSRVFSTEKNPTLGVLPGQAEFILSISQFTGSIVPTIPGEEPDATCWTNQSEEGQGKEEEEGGGEGTNSGSTG